MRLSYIFLFIFSITNLTKFAFCQEMKATSTSAHYNITKQRSLPLEWGIKMQPFISNDPNTNGKLDALETIEIKFKVKNMGPGDGNNLRLEKRIYLSPYLETLQMFGVNSISYTPIGPISAGEEKYIILSIQAGKELRTGTLSLEMDIIEPNGYALKEPVKIKINTKEYIPPKLTITEWECTCASEVMAEGETCQVKVKFKNEGEGVAKRLQLDLKAVNEFVGPTKGSWQSKTIDELLPGAEDSIFHEFIVSEFNQNKDVEFNIQIKERFSENSIRDFRIVPMGKMLETEASRITRLEREQQIRLEEMRQKQEEMKELEDLSRLNDLCGESIKLLIGNWSSDRDINQNIAKVILLQFEESNNKIYFKLIENIFYGTNPRDIDYTAADPVFDEEFLILDCKINNGKTTISAQGVTSNNNVNLSFVAGNSANKHEFTFDGILRKDTGETETNNLELNTVGKLKMILKKIKN